jgi:hypothetical protein
VGVGVAAEALRLSLLSDEPPVVLVAEDEVKVFVELGVFDPFDGGFPELLEAVLLAGALKRAPSALRAGAFEWPLHLFKLCLEAEEDGKLLLFELLGDGTPALELVLLLYFLNSTNSLRLYSQ